jgi:hypothetical protein
MFGCSLALFFLSLSPNLAEFEKEEVINAGGYPTFS